MVAARIGANAWGADLANPDDREGLIERITNEHGPIDVLVNNAAMIFHPPAVDDVG